MAMRNFIFKIFNNRWIFFRKALVFQAGTEKELFNFTGDDNSLEIIFPAELRDIPNMEEISNISPSWPKQFGERLKSSNYYLFLIKKNNSLAYFSWVSIVNEIDQYVCFNSHSFSNEPYLFNCYTLPLFRGIGLHTFATSYLMDYYLKRKKLLWGIIYSDNIAAIKSWKKAGMIKQGVINAFGFLKFKKSVFKSVF